MAEVGCDTSPGGGAGGTTEADGVWDGSVCQKAGVCSGGRVSAEKREKVAKRNVGAELFGRGKVGGERGGHATRPKREDVAIGEEAG